MVGPALGQEGCRLCPGGSVLEGTGSPCYLLGQVEAVGLLWEQVEQCHGSCCGADLPSAPKGPCTQVSLSSVALRPGVRGPLRFQPCGAVDAAPPAPASPRARRWLGALHTPGWDIPEVSWAVVRTWAALRLPRPVFIQASLSSRALSTCCRASELLARWGRHVQRGTARHGPRQGLWQQPQPKAAGSRMAGALGRAVPDFCLRRAVAAAGGHAWTPRPCPR